MRERKRSRRAQECRRSWIRTSSSPARFRMRRQGRCKSVRWDPGSRPAMTQGLSSSRDRAESTARASGPSGTTRRPFLASGSSMWSSFTCSQRRYWISDNRQPVSSSRRKAATADGISSSASQSTSPSRSVSSGDRNRSRWYSLKRFTCRHGLEPSGRQPQISAKENIFDKTPASGWPGRASRSGRGGRRRCSCAEPSGSASP